jgi:hypothetical protein
MAWVTLLPSHAQQKEPPESLEFESKMGVVTFDHAKHAERVKGDCATCHEKLFPQSREPLNYKEKMHQGTGRTGSWMRAWVGISLALTGSD